MQRWKVLKEDNLWMIFGVDGIKDGEYKPEYFVELHMDVLKAFDFKDKEYLLKHLEKND